MHLIRTAGLFVLAAVLTLHGQDRPIVFNNADAGDTPLDRAVKKAYASTYDLRDVSTTEGYTSPTPTAGELPTTATDPSGAPLEGYVLVAYIIDAEGKTRDPVVLQSTNADLNPTALEAVRSWRFLPGAVRDTKVATTAAQEFTFTSPRPPFETTNIVLFHPDAIAQERLSGPGHLAAFIEKLQTTIAKELEPSTTPASLQVVVAVRPGEASRVWVTAPGLDPAAAENLQKKLSAIPPVVVRGGPIAFALVGSIRGGEVPDQAGFPLPSEWRAAAPSGAEPDAVLDAVWPAP